MKPFILILACCVLFVNSLFAGSTVTLKGKIQNPISDSIIVTYSPGWIGYEAQTYSTRLEPDGSFLLSFPIENKFTQITITHGDQATELFSDPGDDLVVTLDAKNFDSTLHYEGKGAAAANFLAKHVLQRQMSRNIYSHLQDAYRLAPEKAEQKLDSVLNDALDFLKNNGKGLSKEFKKIWTAKLQ